MADSTLVKTAQVSAIVAAAAASGGIISISIFTIPSLLLKRAPSANTRTATTLAAPISHIARQWQYAYDIGKKLFPSMAVTSSLLYSFAAYTLGKERGATCRQVSLLYTAAGLNIMIAPFTLLAIVAVNNVIAPYTTGKHDLPVDAKEDAQYEQTEKEFVGQLEKWSLLNVIRGLFPLAGAGLGAAVTFGLLS
ncbi:hypothetical protein TMatcc_008817 [Talaromyces marneffei ATCC 18224]|uniref:DUF1772 domain protein n=1 Tax=Talaromyces marneffei (strain ATCC 18224 / CBS 334.59 / QM 7333) TaxID=441960 RepID=B6QKY3_TALMQ|nr:conserved hypothetical protein [Talaromyces marneffei ATCC 18224]KAE8550763.1 hypothetical protein EYB25_006991 [Talaromyces marneffei]